MSEARAWLLASAVTLVAVASVAAPLAAAPDVDPKRLVLRKADLPNGFELEDRTSRYLSNRAFTRGRPALQKLVAESGRLDGYLGVYRKPVRDRVRIVASGVDLFRGPAGARMFLLWTDREEREDNTRRIRKGQPPYGRKRAGVGAEGWMYLEGPPASSVRVVWRQGRAMGAVHAWGIGRQGTLELAREQQRRIADALR